METAQDTKTNIPLLELAQVSLVYDSSQGSVEALKDVDMKIYSREFVCVLGPSGCGKSTLLSLIAGFQKATTGEILLEGERIEGIDRHRGVVFQRDNLFEWFNVRNNISYGLRMRGMGKKEIKEQTDSMLEKMGLTEFADKKVYELSGGGCASAQASAGL
ncbi:MAG: ATP-binding cassette domain-containing protein [Lachnospiraceae bacterium]|nr:ATP-binding cassette domain-containing protein [Lachnospiraceae bacterium]